MTTNGDRATSPDVLLVSCYELGHQPINLASPLAALAAVGHTARAVDLAVEPLAPVLDRPVRMVGISVPMHTALRIGEAAAREIRTAHPEAHICFYGHYAELNGKYLLAGAADSIIAGEYESALVNLASALDSGQYDEAAPPEGVRTRQALAAPTIRRIPFAQPIRESLPPLNRYAHFVWQNGCELAGYVEASRGCKHTCRHCPITPIYKGRFFVVPVETVLADIRVQAAWGARHITFGDPDFLNGPGHALRILRAFHTEFPQLTFDFTAKIEHLRKHAALLPEFSQLGCAFIVSAVESLSDNVLTALDKGHSHRDVLQVIDELHAVGITLRPSLLPFTPWATLDDYLDLLRFVRDYDLTDSVDPVHLSIRLLIPPGSAVLDISEAADWLGHLDRENYTYTWTHPDPRMDQLQAEVAALVAAAEQDQIAAPITFTHIEKLAFGLAGQTVPEFRPRVSSRPPAPHLTESWFC